MDALSKSSLKTLFLPGGLLLLAALILLQTGVVLLPAAAISTFFYATFVAGLLLAWRFNSSRAFFTLTVLLLSQRALAFFSQGHIPLRGPGHSAFEAMCLLIPLNFILLSRSKEKGFALPHLASRIALIFVESVWVAILCRPSAANPPAFLHAALVSPLHAIKIPQLSLGFFAAAVTVLLVRFLQHRKSIDSGMLWALFAAALSLQTGAVGPLPTAYFGVAALTLVGALIENSYVLAYQDELTGLPSRRAFNEALLRLEDRYAIAAVDIDHFKKFNDTYGHDTGDQVLRLVAGRLATVTGGGKAYRVGGEEFSVLFADKNSTEVFPHLEQLRSRIESSLFKVRNGGDRRSAATREAAINPNSGDRRSSPRRTGERSEVNSPLKRSPDLSRVVSFENGDRNTREISVTVSIGVAHATPKSPEPEAVMRSADKALYRAKKAGRNRVESASSARNRSPRSNRRITA